MQASEEATGRIRIVRIPEGEAPEEIRRAWVGIDLPCYPFAGFGGSKRGVISGEESRQKGRWGFSVPQEQAIRILDQLRPEAAAWWRAHGFPKPRPLDLFSFQEDEVEIISGVTHQQIEVWDDQDGNPRK